MHPMGFYRRWLFPRLCHRTLGAEHFMELRQRTLASARGRVLELGVGTGLNLDCYPAAVEALVGIDPNPGMLELAARQAERSPRPVELVSGRGESLPCADRSFETVVSTVTLCSVDDPAAVLAEAHRVLAPGGRLLFLEHGLADEPRIARWQRRLTPLQRRLGDGCHLDRDFAALFAVSPFTVDQLDSGFDPRMPKLAGYFYRGAAVRG
ncbi:MAG TPA: class I SAM-dependent methyltransferase [Woeseiaceae bacterium]|nr:class I SAM-dependent methyltransferase [Woeseiaceae bacterium]